MKNFIRIFSLLFIFISTNLFAIELVDEQFPSNIDGWTVSSSSKVYHSSSYSGSMFIDRDDWGEETYNFGSSYIDQTLDVVIDWCAKDEWDTTGDHLLVTVNGSTYTDYNDGGCQTFSFSADADFSGDFTIRFFAQTNHNSEDAYIEGFTVNGTPINTGCDNTLDTSANNSSPGVTITDMHNITTNTTDCVSGSSASDDNDYYNFTVSAPGTLNIVTSSPNSNDNHFEVISSINGTLYSYDTGQDRSLSYTLATNEQIIFRIKETGEDTDWWQVNLEFIPIIIPEVPPVMNDISNQNVTKDELYSFSLLPFVTLTNSDPIISYSLTGSLPTGLSFNTSTGVISGTATVTGTFNLAATATDNDGPSNTRTFSLVVSDIPLGCTNYDSSNHADPGRLILSMDQVNENRTRCITGSSTDGDIADYYYFTVQAYGTLDVTGTSPNSHDYHLKIGSSFNGSQYYSDTTSQNHTVGPIPLEPGDTIYFYVKETGDDTDEYELEFTFTKTNARPIADAGPDQFVEIGTNVTLDGSGSTDDGSIASYSWSTGDTGVNPVISGLAIGTHSITLTVTDNQGTVSLIDTVNIYVSAVGNDAPVISSNGGGTTADITISEASTNVTTVYAIDPDGDTLTYSISGGADSALFSIDSNTGVLTLQSAGTSGDIYVVTVTATDPHSASDSQILTVTIDDPLVLTSGDRDFSIRNPLVTRNIQGNYIIGGNMNLCEDDGSGNCRNTNSNSNSNDDIYIDIDGDVSTMNSTSFDLNIPAKSKVVWAGLYWQGVVHRSRPEDGGDDFMGGTVPSNAPLLGGSTNQIDLTNNTYGAEIVKLKLPGASGYTEVTADQLDFSRLGYGGFSDVTSLLDVNNPNGTYMLADIKCHEGAEPNHGNYGGWALVTVYTNQGEDYRNITIFDGFATVDSNYKDDLIIDGFLTPNKSPINSKLAYFTMDGEGGSGGTLNVISDSLGGTKVFGPGNPVNSIFNSTITGVYNRQPDYPSLRLDLDVFEMANILAPLETRATLQPRSGGDRYTASFFIMSSELYIPKLCYDYSYKQSEQFFTEDNNGSKEPSIIGSELSTSDPVTVEIYVRNTEDSDISAENMFFNILDINTTQARYIHNSTYVVLPNEVFPVQNIDTNYGSSYNRDIPIGTINRQDFFYVDYDLDILRSDIDMPLNITLNYELVLPGLRIPYETYLGSGIPICTEENFSYVPKYGEFNVENSILSQSQKYNLPTQTANRAGDFVVTSYDVTNIHTRKDISTPVAIELIDAGKYHGVEASCYEPDSALTPRVWVIFDNNVSVTNFDHDTITTAITNGTVSDQISGGTTPITTAGEFYGRAVENAAFRIGFNRAGNGDEIIQLESNACKGQQIAPCVKVLNFPDLSQVDLGNGAGRCIQDIDGNPNNADTIPQNCGNAGNAGMDSVQLAVCMECIYGYNIDYLCSRDNFAIRPESFRMSLKDQNQSDNTIQSDITTNDDTTLTHASSNALQIVAGYDYALDINATNHQNDNNTPGYYASFLEDGNGSNRSIRLNWETSADDTKCNDTEDHNQTTTFFNGTTSLQLNSPQIGKYTLTMLDRLWTQVDHNSAFMTHHTTGDGAGYFQSGTDCTQDSSAVPVANSSTTSYTEDVSGCDITTYNTTLTPKYHTNVNTNNVYTDIALRIHPYEFNHAGVIPAIGPYTRTNGQNFVYMNTPPTLDMDNKNMSYNMNGTFFAAGYDSGRLSNFVTGCYADDVNMGLNYTYNSPPPTQEPYLWYSLKDHNTTDAAVIYRPASGSDDFDRPAEPSSSIMPLSITQGEQFFAKEMDGSITMDLGYNFKRTYNKRVNPRFIEFKDFNITYVSNPSSVKADLKDDFQIFGNKTLDTNVTFVYGRAKPSQYFYEDVTENFVDTPISIVVYCDQDPITCSAVYNINSALGKTDEYNWYLSLGHITSENDGNITLDVNSSIATVTPTDPTAVNIENSGGINNPNVRVTAAVATRPLDVDIDFGTNTNRWLIYNKSLDAIPSPFYRVRFIGQSDWAGHGDTGHVVGSNSSSKKNRRLGW